MADIEVFKKEHGSLQFASDYESIYAKFFKIASEISKTKGLVPDSMLGNPGGVAAMMVFGMNMGMDPLMAPRNFYPIKSKLSIETHAMKAIIKHFYKDAVLRRVASKSNSEQAVVEAGPKGDTQEYVYTLSQLKETEQYKKALATKGQDKESGNSSMLSHPENHLLWKCTRFAAMCEFQECFSGIDLREAEEIEDHSETVLYPSTKDIPEPVIEAEVIEDETEEESLPPKKGEAVPEAKPSNKGKALSVTAKKLNKLIEKYLAGDTDRNAKIEVLERSTTVVGEDGKVKTPGIKTLFGADDNVLLQAIEKVNVWIAEMDES